MHLLKKNCGLRKGAWLFNQVLQLCLLKNKRNISGQIFAQASPDKLIRYQYRQAQTISSVTLAHQIRSLAQCRLSSVPCRSFCFELTVQSSCFTFLVLTVLQPDIVQAPQDGASEKPSKEFEHGQEQEQAKSGSLGNKRTSAYCVGFYQLGPADLESKIESHTLGKMYLLT